MGKGNFSRETYVKGIAAVVIAVASLGMLRVGDYVLPQDTDTGAEAGDAAVAEAEVVSTSGLAFTPGTYTATAKGMSDVTVTCTFDEAGITDMTVDVSGETPGLGADIGDQMIEAILGAQSTDVDNVSGVTLTSTAIKNAVGDCIAQASGTGTEAETGAAEEAAAETEAVTEAAAAEESSEAPAAEAADTAAAAGYTPGTYTAVGQGIGGDVTVEVTFDESSITDMTVDVSNETPGLGADIGDQMIEAVKAAQSSEVDSIAGVTITSDAIKAAVADCIAQAGGGSAAAAETEAVTEAAAAEEVSGMQAEEAAETEFTGILAGGPEVEETEAEPETPSGLEGVLAAGVWSEDAAAGDAAEAETEAGDAAEGAAGAYVPGTYTAAAKGIESDVTVEVTFDESSITDVTVDVSGETAGIGAEIGDVIVKQILEAQSDAVDGVAGATITSDAVKAAVADCIAQAGAGSAEAAGTEEAAETETVTEAAAETEFTGVLAGGPETEETEAEPETGSGLEGVLAAGTSSENTEAETGAEIAEEGAAGAYVPGTYTAAAKGIESDVTVEVTFDESSITDVTVDVSGETAGIGAEIGDVIVKQILEAQSDAVDGVAGATITSDAVKAAVADCIAQAGGSAEAAETEAGAEIETEAETEEVPETEA